MDFIYPKPLKYNVKRDLPYMKNSWFWDVIKVNMNSPLIRYICKTGETRKKQHHKNIEKYLIKIKKILYLMNGICYNE